MVVGVCQVELSIYDNFSLKGKRSVVRRVVERTRKRFNVAMNEVDANDELNRAVLGFAVVGNDGRFVNSVIDKVLVFIEDLGLAPISHHEFEIIHF